MTRIQTITSFEKEEQTRTLVALYDSTYEIDGRLYGKITFPDKGITCIDSGYRDGVNLVVVRHIVIED